MSKTKVMVFGTFDILHLGHLHFFRAAKKYGDELIVVVARDINAQRTRKDKPWNDENARVDFLTAIKDIDQVELGSETDPYEVIRKIRPETIALGYDQKLYVDDLANALMNMGLEKTAIVRLSPFQPERYKSSYIKNYCSKNT